MTAKHSLALAVVALALSGTVNMAGAQTASPVPTTTPTVATPTQTPVAARQRPIVADTVEPANNTYNSTVTPTQVTNVQDTTVIREPVVMQEEQTLPVSGSMETTVALMTVGLMMVAAGAFFSLKRN